MKNNKSMNKNKTAIILTLLGIVIALFILLFVFMQSTVSDHNRIEQPTAIPSITPTKVPAPTSVAVPTISPTAIITNFPTPTEETSNNTPTPVVNSTMKVHFIDVDQGDSILVEENGHFMLIDAGVNEKGATVVKYLKNLGVVKLDYVIATHPHNDHIGGLDTVIDAYKVGNVIMPDVSIDSENYADVLESITDHNLSITRPVVGDNYTLGNASFVIISPNSSSYESLNDYSIGINLTYGSNSFILTGDAQAVSEAEMLENGIDLSADVLKLNHHGSSTSSTINFLNKVDPEYTVISVGTGNKYEHPHSATMQAINDRDIDLYRTNKQGSIIFTSDGKTISVNVKPYVITTSDMTSDAAEKAAIAKGY
jgi:competence protein ComEC